MLDVDLPRCELIGTGDGRPATLIYDCISSPNMEWVIDGGAVGTGTPPAIAAAWIAEGRIKARGVVPPEIAVDPLPFFRELGAKGRTLEVWERDGKRERLLSKAA
jgi:saccharopine dehydrogenase-like NADP-dependent oxidoreductase